MVKIRITISIITNRNERHQLPTTAIQLLAKSRDRQVRVLRRTYST